MELSTLIILLIALFIVIYRIKTWNDVDPVSAVSTEVEDSEAETVEKKDTKKKTAPNSETVAKKVAPEKSKSVKNSAAKSEKNAASLYKKKLKKDVAKNEILLSLVTDPEQTLKTLVINDQPQSGSDTYISMTNTTEDRAQGAIFEKDKSGVTLIKSFDVKLQSNGSFKVATAFSKSLTVKVSEMKNKKIVIKHMVGDANKRYALQQVTLTLV